MYLGEQDTFDAYAMSVYEYLVDNYFDSLGYSSEILQSFFVQALSMILIIKQI